MTQAAQAPQAWPNTQNHWSQSLFGGQAPPQDNDDKEAPKQKKLKKKKQAPVEFRQQLRKRVETI